MSNKKEIYKLHLSPDDLEMLRSILDSYDWLCNCSNFPACPDFIHFKQICERVETLEERCCGGQMYGYKGYDTMVRHLKQEARDEFLAAMKEVYTTDKDG